MKDVFCFISKCKFGSFRNPFATITSLSELYLKIRRFILLAQTKKCFLWTMATAEATENHRDDCHLTLYSLRGIYTSIPTSTHSQNWLAAAEALSLKISSRGTSLKWSQRPSQSAWEKLQAMQWNRAPCYEFDGKPMETEIWSKVLNGGKATVEQILVSEERNKSKRAGPLESQPGIRVGKFTIWVWSFERKL